MQELLSRVLCTSNYSRQRYLSLFWSQPGPVCSCWARSTSIAGERERNSRHISLYICVYLNVCSSRCLGFFGPTRFDTSRSSACVGFRRRVPVPLRTRAEGTDDIFVSFLSHKGALCTEGVGSPAPAPVGRGSSISGDHFLLLLTACHFR